MNSARDHIFISYAGEDMVLADWLARKLASLGYAVWYDRFKLLGGEPWPQDIDHAIKKRTFRMLGLLSRASLEKSNPTKERTLAQQLAKDFGESDFLIPLNLDGLRPAELTWTLVDTNYISFTESWADGLRAVLKKLDAIAAPRVLANGRELAAATFENYSDVVRNDQETLLSNCFPINHVPNVVHCFNTREEVSKETLLTVRQRWPCRQLAPQMLAAFEPPPDGIQRELGAIFERTSLWAALNRINGVNSRDLVVSLIHIAITTLMEMKGLLFSTDRKQWYFPDGLVEGNRLRFTRPDGIKSWVQSLGQRTFGFGTRSEPYRYHLSPSFTVLRGTSNPFLLVLRNHLYLTSENGTPLVGRKVSTRRKHLCKNWWNEEWLNRALAIVQFFADGTDSISIGQGPQTQLVISAAPLSHEVPVRIIDHRADTPNEADFVREDDDAENEDGGGETNDPESS